MKHVLLNPDGTWSPGWLMVVVEAKTGVVYEQQCGGLATDHRSLEGYLVPIGGLKFDPDDGRISTSSLTAPFHRGSSCVYALDRLPPERLQLLRREIEALPYWATTSETDERLRLQLDESRLDEVVEAWVPVRTPDGPGVLVWHNCD